MAPELWDCVAEEAPFGSDEGADAYEEYRRWRAENPTTPLIDCIRWIGDERDYGDPFTFDATILATVLGQLVVEGHIDADVKPFVLRAIDRQRIGASASRSALLGKIRWVVEKG